MGDTFSSWHGSKDDNINEQLLTSDRDGHTGHHLGTVNKHPCNPCYNIDRGLKERENNGECLIALIRHSPKNNQKGSV